MRAKKNDGKTLGGLRSSKRVAVAAFDPNPAMSGTLWRPVKDKWLRGTNFK
jgi:hypothetical protein